MYVDDSTRLGVFMATTGQAGVLFTTDKLRSIDARATRLKEQYADVQR